MYGTTHQDYNSPHRVKLLHDFLYWYCHMMNKQLTRRAHSGGQLYTGSV